MYKITTEEKQHLCATRRNKLIRNATKSELQFKSRLDALKIKYLFQKGFIAGNYFCIVDFYLPRPYKIVVEIDGDYHNSPEMMRRDANKDSYLKSRKIRVVRIKNSAVNTVDIFKLISK